MSAAVKWDGLQEFRDALRNLPQTLTGEAHAIVVSHAEYAAREVQSGYQQGPTGNLRKRVTTEVNTSRFSAGARVRSRAPHSSIYENGTKARRTDRGLNRGAMPEPATAHKMIPKVIRHRARMVRALMAMLERNGLVVQVTG